MSYSIKWVQSPNYRKGRSGYKPIAIVNHITAGQFPGCLNWLCNPQAKASSTYLVNRMGEIYQLVKEEDTHWANGGVNNPTWSLYNGANPNLYTISIEHEGYGSNGGDGTLTEQQYQATLWLHKQIIDRWNIPIDREHIIGHYRIDSVNRPNCPGKNFPWDRLFNDLQSQNNPKIIVGDKTFEGLIYQGSTIAPIRIIAESLGYAVQFDNATKTVLVNGVKIKPLIINNTSYCSVRYLFETLDYKVNWDANTKTVYVYK